MKEDTVFIGIRVKKEIKNKIEKIAKRNLRSVSKEIEMLIRRAK
jgi:hypothetical protein